MTEAVTDPVVTDPVVTPVTKTSVAETVTDPTPKPEATPEPAPLEYTDFAVPEGSTLDGGVLEDYKLAAKECGLDQANAQKLIEFGAIAQAKALEKISAAWSADSINDKEFGGNKLNENLAIASKARDAFATPELQALLESSRLGNHPEMIRVFYKIGKAMSEDNLVPGGRAPSASQSAAEKLYGNH
jgi:hypothetical protein